MSEMTPRMRREIVKELFESGKTLKEIGDIMGVSRERARQLYVSAKRREPAESKRSELEDLYLKFKNTDIRQNVSRRTMNALSVRLGVQTIRELIELDPLDVMKARYVGLKALKEILWFKKRVTEGGGS
jgi:predicted transcriptional regulator